MPLPPPPLGCDWSIGLLVITKFKLLKMVLCRVAPCLLTRACFLSHTVSLALFLSFPFSYFFLPFLSFSYVCHIIVESLKSRFIVTFSFVFILITLQANFMLKETNVDYI